MNVDVNKLTALFSPSVTAMEYELLGCELAQQEGDAVLRVYIDKVEGIHVDDCAKVSHQLSAVLDVEDPIPFEYRLEVSSPGWNRPLFTIAHYEQAVGERVKVKTYEPVIDRKNLTGTLKAVEGNIIKVQMDNVVYDIEFNNIKKGHLAPFTDK